jgi:hypothetical protein
VEVLWETGKAGPASNGLLDMKFKPPAKHNFGRINGSGGPIVGFKISGSLVYPAPVQRQLARREVGDLWPDVEPISPREAFRRWKIARKAWRTRRWRNQLKLGL